MSGATAGSRQRSVVELICHHARATPDRDLLVAHEDGGRRSWTYAAFDAATDRIAAGLAASGFGPRDRLGLCLDNTSAGTFYLLLHGAYKASLVPVPINTRLAPPEIAYIVRDSGSRTVVLPAALQPGLSGEDLGGAEVRGPELAQELGAADGSPPEPPGLEAPADLLYTSGTTGRPKGARFVHRALASFAQQLSATLRLSGDDVFQTPAPIYTSTGTHTLPLPVLAAGGTYVVEPGFDVVLSAERLRAEGSTVYFAVPAMLILLLEKLPPEMHFPSLRSLMYGGSLMPEPIVRRLLERFPGSGLWNLYGLTEGGPNGTVLPPELALERPSSVGRPPEGTQIRIVDDRQREVPVGESGEIAIVAPSMMEGYHNLPQATAEAIVDGWLLTGDVGRVDDDGLLYIVDRKKDMIVRGGFNVYPSEVETVLLEHPDVLEVAVVGVSHPVLGEDIGAVVHLRPGATGGQRELEVLCAARLADFKRPRQWRFVDALPRNAMGKLLKRELRDGWPSARPPERSVEAAWGPSGENAPGPSW